ncbi:MAG TPA: site-specific integrase [Thermoanaerobaculia bacterium]|nr:site-specific integrase [Thermoanaerobaculia bacterium]
MATDARRGSGNIPVVPYRGVVDPAHYAVLQVPTRPFQFPSLQHLDAAVETTVQRMRELHGISPTTAAWVRASYRAFRSFLHEPREQRRFTSGDLAEQIAVLESWIVAMRGRGLRRSAISAYWRGLATACRWLTRASGVTNPTSFVRAPTVGRLQPRFLPRDAAERVLTYVQHFQWRTEFERHRNTAVVALMLLAGLRRGEVIRLRVGDVNLVAGTLLVREAKGPDGGRDRVAYMPPQLRTLLAAYSDARRAYTRTRRAPEFIVSTTADRGVSANTINRICGLVSARSGVHVAPHMLRHSYATLLRQAGVPDRLAMELLGHADLRMLLRYSHVVDGEAQQAADRLRLGL